MSGDSAHERAPAKNQADADPNGFPDDSAATIGLLRSMVADFVNERRWQQFHTPKNLCMALAVEAAELMEHFQWLTPEEAERVVRQPEKLHAVGEELADVLCYALALANALHLDVARAMQAKMVKNRGKYPVEAIRGRFGHDDPRPAQ